MRQMTKAKVNAAAERLAELEAKETELAASIRRNYAYDPEYNR